MEKKQQQRFDMIQATCTFLRNNRAVWEGNARLGALLDKLCGVSASIASSNTAFKNGATAGYTKEEHARLHDAAEAILRLTNVVKEWALDQDNKILLEQVRCNHTDLTLRLRKADGVEKMNSLYSVCLAEAPGIPGCTLSAEDFRAARAAIDIYVSLNGLKRQKKDARKAERINVLRLMEAVTPILQQLDLQLRNYEAAHPEFYQQYHQARQILETGGRKAVRISKKSTKQPDLIKNVKPAAEPPKPATDTAATRMIADIPPAAPQKDTPTASELEA